MLPDKGVNIYPNQHSITQDSVLGTEEFLWSVRRKFPFNEKAIQ